MHPVLFQFHSLTVYSYGFCVALAVAAALGLSLKRAGRHGLSPSTAADLLFIIFVAGVIGARAFYVLQHPGEYRGRWASAFWLREGGLVWYGGFLLAGVASFFYCRRRGEPTVAWADFFAPVIALGHAIGRIGCHFNGCCYGRDGHPAPLYESAGLFVLSAFLFWNASRKPGAGTTASWYLVLYAALRFFLEFFRADQSLYLRLSLPQWMSLALFAAGLVCLRAAHGSRHENRR